MRQASKRIPDSAKKTVRDIRRNTRRHIRPKRRSASCWKAFAVRSALPNSAARKASIRTSIHRGLPAREFIAISLLNADR